MVGIVDVWLACGWHYFGLLLGQLSKTEYVGLYPSTLAYFAKMTSLGTPTIRQRRANDTPTTRQRHANDANDNITKVTVLDVHFS